MEQSVEVFVWQPYLDIIPIKFWVFLFLCFFIVSHYLVLNFLYLLPNIIAQLALHLQTHLDNISNLDMGYSIGFTKLVADVSLATSRRSTNEYL